MARGIFKDGVVTIVEKPKKTAIDLPADLRPCEVKDFLASTAIAEENATNEVFVDFTEEFANGD